MQTITNIKIIFTTYVRWCNFIMATKQDTVRLDTRTHYKVIFTQYQNTKSHLLFKSTRKASFSRTISTFTQDRKETQMSHVSGIILSKLLVCHFISTLLRTKNSCHHGWLLSDTRMEQSLARIHPRIPSSLVMWVQNLVLQLLLVTRLDWWVKRK